MRRLTGSRRRPEQGVALVTALLVVSLATVAAVSMATRLQVDLRRAGNLLQGEQAYAYAIAAESWAYVILRRDLDDSSHDSLDEDWATALPPIAVEGGLVNGQIEDLTGRFNVNNVVDASGGPNVPELDYFKRLLDVLDLAPALAPALLDWIDANITVTFPDGAEDEVYLLAEPPYRAGNRPLVSVSELRLVKGFTPDVLAALAPHITALPPPTAINVNTATSSVLKALDSGLSDSDVEKLIEDRGDEGYQSKSKFIAHSALAGRPLAVDVDVKSDWFNVVLDVTVGRGQARIESHIRRTGTTLKVVSRVRTRRRLLPPEVTGS